MEETTYNFNESVSRQEHDTYSEVCKDFERYGGKL